MPPSTDWAWSVPGRLTQHVAAGGSAEVLYVHIPFGCDLEATAGVQRHAAMMVAAVDAARVVFEESGHPFGLQVWPMDDIVAWIAGPAPEGIETALAAAVREAVRDLDVPQHAGEIAASRRALRTSCGDAVRGYARAVREAQREACDPDIRELKQRADLMELALVQRAFVFHYQPIVDCQTRAVLAHEALCRGTLEGLRFPDVIFGVAERTSKVWELGRVLRDRAATELDARDDDDERLLFINVHPGDIDDPVFLEQALSGGLSQHASRIVVELTERAAIDDYRRVKAIFATLRRCGYRLAIDDLGSGYAGLTALAELEPDFIKFDMGLVRDLHLHPVKQRLIGRMHEFALEIGAETISEGVECAEERDALLDNGCTKMQGYLFARPAPGWGDVPDDRFPHAAEKAS